MRPSVEVTLIEANPTYSSSFFSNLYIGGFRPFSSLTHGYADLRKVGVKVVHDRAAVGGRSKKVVTMREWQQVPYDKLVLSPGIEVKYEVDPGLFGSRR